MWIQQVLQLRTNSTEKKDQTCWKSDAKNGSNQYMQWKVINGHDKNRGNYSLLLIQRKTKLTEKHAILFEGNS
jgi:hypothetical protein